ncbi:MULTISPECIES: anti-sigma factor [Sphingomonas]|uniref:anti-sigma factor n=1 Tax=Sphingomonas TaxID=13687 RepID=UPI0013B39ED4|nr:MULTISPECIES: anti-sigma factor [Sphingomonas]
MSTDQPAGDWQAAELALGLLDGVELDAARRRAATDPRFAAEVAGWSRRLAPLLDEVGDTPPPSSLWAHISGALGGRAPAAVNDNAVDVHRRLAFWQRWSAGATAVAAALGLFLLVEPRPTPPPPPAPTQPTAEAPMVAAMASKDSDAKLVATWEPTARSLTVAAAGDMPNDGAHSHELWFIVSGAKPKSLGVMPLNGRMHAQLAAEIAAALRQGTVLAISVEPTGGSPTGQPTGPVIASGALLPT